MCPVICLLLIFAPYNMHGNIITFITEVNYLHNFLALKLLSDRSQDMYSPLAGTEHIINYLQGLGIVYCVVSDCVYIIATCMCSVLLCSYAK